MDIYRILKDSSRLQEEMAGIIGFHFTDHKSGDPTNIRTILSGTTWVDLGVRNVSCKTTGDEQLYAKANAIKLRGDHVCYRTVSHVVSLDSDNVTLQAIFKMGGLNGELKDSFLIEGNVYIVRRHPYLGKK